MLDTDKIEMLRRKLGLTQEEAAAKSRLGGKQVWSDIVNGRRQNVTLETLYAIASTLGVKPQELLK